MNGLRISETIRPSVLDCWERKLRATRFGRYPNRSTAAITRVRTSGRTCRPLESTRDTVAVDTPAASATSLMPTIRTPLLEEQTCSCRKGEGQGSALLLTFRSALPQDILVQNIRHSADLCKRYDQSIAHSRRIREK